jgi:RNA recognition motif-containing protein
VTLLTALCALTRTQKDALSKTRSVYRQDGLPAYYAEFLQLLGEDALMPKSIYVGNLPWSATEDQVEELFGSYGKVLSVKLVNDRETGRARGFGFVEMDEPDASAAVEALDNSSFGGRTLRVNEAKPRAPRPPRY